MKFRSATNQDQSVIESLIFSVLREHGLEPFPDSTDADLADIEGEYFSNGGLFDLLLDESGEVVGTVAIHRTDDTLCELRKMYLAASMRKHGLGAKLLDHALEGATRLGYKKIWLETAETLDRAYRLYESYGFRDFNSPHLADRCDVAMIRDL